MAPSQWWILPFGTSIDSPSSSTVSARQVIGWPASASRRIGSPSSWKSSTRNRSPSPISRAMRRSVASTYRCQTASVSSFSSAA